jgi:hypothetical protein
MKLNQNLKKKSTPQLFNNNGVERKSNRKKFDRVVFVFGASPGWICSFSSFSTAVSCKSVV